MLSELRQRPITTSAASLPSSPSTTPAPQPPSLLTRMANGVTSGVKRFGQGAAGGALFGAAALAAQELLLLGTGTSRLSIYQEVATKVRGLVGIQLNVESILNADCPLKEFVGQWNIALWMAPQAHLSVLSIKTLVFGIAGVAFPLLEEIAYRGLVQDIILKRIPKFIVKKVAKGNESFLDSHIAKVARIAITTALFSAMHLMNRSVMADFSVNLQVAATFVGGIGLGILKESNPGLLGAIGAHFAWNVVGLSPVLLSC